jgi:hypothetical protein
MSLVKFKLIGRKGILDSTSLAIPSQDQVATDMKKIKK